MEEYLRTVGALYAVYWLMRLELPHVAGSNTLDGQRGFCFGVNAKWKPPSALELERGERESLMSERERSRGRDAAGAPPPLPTPQSSGGKGAKTRGDTRGDPPSISAEIPEFDKRLHFMRSLAWDHLHNLLIDAGILIRSDVEDGSLHTDAPSPLQPVRVRVGCAPPCCIARATHRLAASRVLRFALLRRACYAVLRSATHC